MGIHVVWDNDERTIIRMDYDVWGWTDVHAALQQYQALSTAVAHPVNVIMNVKKANALPLEGALTNLQHAMSFIEHKVVFVAAKPIGKAIFEVLSKIHPSYPKKILFVETLDEARTLLARLAKQGD